MPWTDHGFLQSIVGHDSSSRRYGFRLLHHQHPQLHRGECGEWSKCLLSGVFDSSVLVRLGSLCHDRFASVFQGWAGFALPSLPWPIGLHKSVKNMRPSNALYLEMDGNTAHSTGMWWTHAGAFYVGGSLYYVEDNKLQYNPGRSFKFERDSRVPCLWNNCKNGYCAWCSEGELLWTRMTNTKAFLTAGVGLVRICNR
jgi:hypothetical protein